MGETSSKSIINIRGPVGKKQCIGLFQTGFPVLSLVNQLRHLRHFKPPENRFLLHQCCFLNLFTYYTHWTSSIVLILKKKSFVSTLFEIPINQLCCIRYICVFFWDLVVSKNQKRKCLRVILYRYMRRSVSSYVLLLGACDLHCCVIHFLKCCQVMSLLYCHWSLFGQSFFFNYLV